MSVLHHIPTRAQQSSMHLPKYLLFCTHVFVCDDTVRASLQPQYWGPFLIITRKDNYFILDFNGKFETVSLELDRIKAASMDKESDVTHPTAVAEQAPATSTPTLPVSQYTKSQSSAPSTSSSAALPPEFTSDMRKTRSGRHVHWPNLRFVQEFN